MDSTLSAQRVGWPQVALLVAAVAATSTERRCTAQEAAATPGRAVLVADGASDWRISLRPGASAPEALAAQELARYVRIISAVDLPIVTEDRRSPRTIRVESAEGDLDGFDLEVTPNGIIVSGHSPRGALYGAYQLLEDMGCRWFYIGALGESTPTSSTIDMPCAHITQKASFRERSVMVAYPTYYRRFDEWIDYLAKIRINNVVIYGQSLEWWLANRDRYLPMLRDRQMILEFGGHLLPSLAPRELFGEHPEYFRMNDKGERAPDKNFCPSSAIIEIVRANARAYFSQTPEITYYHIWADDLFDGGWCKCPRCTGMSPADQNLAVMNAIAGELAEIDPRASLALLAYHDTGEAPTLTPAPNVFLFYAPRERCYRHALNDPDCRRNREEYMPDWLKLHGIFEKTSPEAIHVFNYYTDGLLNREMQPPQVDTIPADARYYRSAGLPVTQNLMVCFRDWHSPPFSLVLFARASWNADIVGWDVLNDFCAHYYGEDLASAMTEYYRKVEESCQLIFSGDPIIGAYIDMTWPPLDPAMRRQKIADANEAREIHSELTGFLDGLLARTHDPMARERLSRERDVCELHQMITELACCHYEGQLLGLQYVGGGVGNEEGERAKALLADVVSWVNKIEGWIARYPAEQEGLIDGWKAYWDSYAQTAEELRAQIDGKATQGD